MTEKPNYAIMRIGKIHTRAMLDAVEWHNTRQIPARRVEGMALPVDWTGQTGRYRDRADKIMKDTGATEDEGKILAVEVLVTASPEWWEKTSEDKQKEWWNAQYAYAKHVFGPGLLSFTPHFDESTPHAHFVGLPLYHAIKKKKGAKPKDPEKLQQRLEEEANAPKIWRLSHDAVFGGGPDGLADRQTEYHGFVAHLGLSRGKNTVGLGIKNIPLKHHAKLLTQIDRDMAREATELAEKRMVLEHYDQQLAAGYADIEERKQHIEKDELRLFAEEGKFRIREEQLAADEAELEERREALRRQVGETQEAARLLNEQETHLSARADEQRRTGLHLISRLSSLDTQENRQKQAKIDMQLREERVREREQAASNREAQNVEADSNLALRQHYFDLKLSEISVLTGVMSGRLTMVLDGNGQPRVTNGKLKPEETKAFGKPWSISLQSPLRHALAMASARKRLADKLRIILSKLRIKRQQIAQKANKAANDLRDANAAQADAKEAKKRAEASKVLAENARRAANDQLEDVERIERSLVKKRAELSNLVSDVENARRTANDQLKDVERIERSLVKKRAELSNLVSDVENARRTANDQLEDVERIERSLVKKRAELLNLESDVADQTSALIQSNDEVNAARNMLAKTLQKGAELHREQATQTAKKAALDKAVADLENIKARMAQDEANIDAKRAQLAADEKKQMNSISVMEHAEKHGASVAVKEGRYVIILHKSDEEPDEVVAASNVHRSVFALVKQRQALTKAMDETQQLADSLNEQRKVLAERFPDQRSTLEGERREDKKKMQNLWANQQANGLGW